MEYLLHFAMKPSKLEITLQREREIEREREREKDTVIGHTVIDQVQSVNCCRRGREKVRKKEKLVCLFWYY